MHSLILSWTSVIPFLLHLIPCSAYVQQLSSAYWMVMPTDWALSLELKGLSVLMYFQLKWAHPETQQSRQDSINRKLALHEGSGSRSDAY